MNRDALGSRMKENYEIRQRHYLARRTPVIIRLDGKAFHTYTSSIKDRHNDNLMSVMNLTAIKLCEEIQGAQIAYIQSDEISILLHDYKTLQTEAWFDYNQSKVESVSAAIAATTFSINSWMIWGSDASSIRPAYFDSRSANYPEAEIVNYFVWRQKDAIRNSISSLAQSLYSHKQLHKKSCSDLQEMCFQKGWNWNDLPTSKKRGRCVVKITTDGNRSKWAVDNEIPEFTQDRAYIEKYLAIEES